MDLQTIHRLSSRRIVCKYIMYNYLKIFLSSRFYFLFLFIDSQLGFVRYTKSVYSVIVGFFGER